MSEKPIDAPDTLHSAPVNDHPHEPDGNGLCLYIYPDDHATKPGKRCLLARPAHKSGPLYVPTAPPAEVEWCTCGHMKSVHTGLSAQSNSHCVVPGCKCERFDAGDDAGRLQEVQQQGGLSVSKTDSILKMTQLPTSGEIPTELLENTETTIGKLKVDSERHAQHGDPVPNMEKIAAAWSVVLARKVTAHQVALAMIEFKIVRSLANPVHWDNYDDMEGYADIARRCAKAERA